MSFQAFVSQFFEWQASLVVRHPLPWLITPPIFSIVLVGLAASNFHLNITNETLQVFLPDDMSSLRDLKELMKLFPPRDFQRDTYSILGSKFAYFILESIGDNVLNKEGLEELKRLHKAVTSLQTSNGLKFEEVCARDLEACLIHPLLMAVVDDPSFAPLFFRYPVLRFGELYVDNSMVFGGVKIDEKKADKDGNSPIVSASAIRAVYVLDDGKISDDWINSFMRAMASWKFKNGTRIFYQTSNSLAKEMERNGDLLIPWMPWAALLLILFCAISCMVRDPVKSQPLMGLAAMANATMATIAATALLLYIEFPFLPLVFIMPFLVISIGVDNMFLMLKSWRISKDEHFEKRFTDAMTETAASLFLTSLTDGLSFAIGAVSDFHAVRVFCTYCAMAILFMFFYQISFFNAAMVFCCRREIAGRHCIMFWKMMEEKKGIPCFASRPLPSIPSNSFGYLLSRILFPIPMRIFIAIVYFTYLSISIFFAFKLPLGLDMKLLPPDGSFVSQEMLAQERLFSNFGPFCFAVIKIDQENLGDPRVRKSLVDLYQELGSSEWTSKGEFWLEEFERNNAGFGYDEDEFMTALHTMLAKPALLKFRTDIRFSMNGSIEATKMLLRTRKLGPASDQPRATFLRKTMKESNFEGFVYDTSFLLVDQQMTTVVNVISNVVIAIVTMLVICVLLVPRPVSAVCVALSIVSINVGVVAALSACSTRLDIISMITIVMSIGFSVDYVTHTTFHYLSQREKRLEKCLDMMTEPIAQAALSTIVGVAPLGLVSAYIIRTFVLTVFFVVAIGILHGLLFLPVLLESIVPHDEYLKPYSADETEHISTGWRITRFPIYGLNPLSDSSERLLGGRTPTNRSQLRKANDVGSGGSKKSNHLKENSKMGSDSSSKKRNSKKGKNKSKKSQKELVKGLSPPKDKPKVRRDLDDPVENDNELGSFDKTQWEKTRWGEEYSTIGPSNLSNVGKFQTRQRKSTGCPKMPSSVGSVLAPTDRRNLVTGKLIPGEARQVEQVRGEHLKRKPTLILTLLGIEGAMCAITIAVWGAATVNPLLPYLLLLINLLVVFSFICAGFFVELCRFQVKKEKNGPTVTKFKISYVWRFILFGGHLARAFLLCCCITIAAMDNDFDGGSIAVLAMQPVHLILVIVQIIIVMKGGKRKE